MKVIIYTTATNSSGGTRQALYLAQELHKAGLLIAFVTPVQSTLRQLDTTLPWVDVSEGIGACNALLLSLSEPYRNQQEKVVIHAFHNKAVKTLAYLGTYWKLRGLGLCCAAHRGVIFKPNNPLPYILPGIDAFIVNSAACAATLPLLWRRKRVHVVYNCIPPERIAPVRPILTVQNELGITDKHCVIGCVANNTPNKGVDVLLQAFAFLPIGTTHLVLVGVNAETWEPICKELGISARVHLVERTEHVADYLQIFNFFVIPSLSESQPNVLLEAMTMGLAAVGSNVGGIPELITCPELLAEPGNAHSLAAALRLLVEDTSLRNEEARKNHEASQAFAPEYKLKKVLALYEQL